MLSENFTWVYPPTIAPDTFGPVHLYDTIELSWTPNGLYIAPPYKIQMACQLANQSLVFVPMTNISNYYPWFFGVSYDTQPYSCWYGFETGPGGTGGTGGAFNVVPVTAATAITYRAAATSSSSSTSTSSAHTTVTAAAATTTPAVTSSSAAAADSGLSSGAKAGIGVGVALGALILIALILGLLVFRRKQKRKQTATELDTSIMQPQEKPPLAFAEAPAQYPYVEVETPVVRHEMMAN